MWGPFFLGDAENHSDVAGIGISLTGLASRNSAGLASLQHRATVAFTFELNTACRAANDGSIGFDAASCSNHRIGECRNRCQNSVMFLI
jgi:hypothetical protein